MASGHQIESGGLAIVGRKVRMVHWTRRRSFESKDTKYLHFFCVTLAIVILSINLLEGGLGELASFSVTIFVISFFSEWAGCQKVGISPDIHLVPYHISFATRTSGSSGRHRWVKMQRTWHIHHHFPTVLTKCNFYGIKQYILRNSPSADLRFDTRQPNKMPV